MYIIKNVTHLDTLLAQIMDDNPNPESCMSIQNITNIENERDNLITLIVCFAMTPLFWRIGTETESMCVRLILHCFAGTL